MGDLPKSEQKKVKSDIEKWAPIKKLVEDSKNLYLASHHAAEAGKSIDKELFTLINPETVVISSGEDNGFLHPRLSAVKTFNEELKQTGFGDKHYIQVFQPSSASSSSAKTGEVISLNLSNINDSPERLCTIVFKLGCKGLSHFRKRKRISIIPIPQGPRKPLVPRQPTRPQRVSRYNSPPDYNGLLFESNILESAIKEISALNFKYKNREEFIKLKENVNHILISIDDQLKNRSKVPNYNMSRINNAFNLAITVSNGIEKNKDRTLQDYEVSKNIYTTKSSGTITYEIDENGNVDVKCYYQNTKNPNRCATDKKSN